MSITVAHIEETTLTWLEALGCQTRYGPDIAPGEPAQERETYGDVILIDQLGMALSQINILRASRLPAP